MTIGNRIIRHIILLANLAAPLAAQAHSGFVTSFPSPGGDLEEVGQVVITQPASSEGDFCIAAQDSVATGRQFPNVIIDVFSYPEQTFIGEGYYYCSPEAGCTNPLVILPRRSSERQITVIMRAAPGTPFQENVPLSVKTTYGSMGCFAGLWSFIGQYDIRPGERQYFSDGLPAQTHVMTVQRQGQTNDTILMAFNGNTPFAFDDNGGVAQRSFLCLPQSCQAGNCYILPAHRSNPLRGTAPDYDPNRFATPVCGPVTLIWDEGAHNQRADMDNDGLGTELEILLGTCDPDHPNNDMDGDGTPDCYDKDVDGDGVPDALEVLGRADKGSYSSSPLTWYEQNTSINLANFPYYGSDPTRQDLFVEAAWAPRCKMSEDPNCTEGNADDNLNANLWKWTDVSAVGYANRFAPDVAVHVDIGDPLPAGTTQTETFGNWGVRRLPDSFDPRSSPGFSDCALNWDCATTWWCGDHRVWTSPRWAGFLHLMVAREPIKTYGMCPRVDDRPGGAAHETGHYLGLHHSGHRACDDYDYLLGSIPGQCYGSDGDVNCKPNYLSVMNYAYQDNQNFGQGADFPGFSHGRFLGSSTGSGDVVLDPTAMDEGRGLWPSGNFDPTNDGPVLDLMRDTFGRAVDPLTGGVDWDMDGNILAPGQSTRAFVNRSGSSDCDRSPPARDSVALIPSTVGENRYGNGWHSFATLAATGTGFAMYLASNCPPTNDPRCKPTIYRTALACAHSGDEPCQTAERWSKYVALENNAYALTAVGDILIFVDGETQQLRYAGRGASGSPVGGTLGGPAVAGPPAAVLDLPAAGGTEGDMRVYAAVTDTSGGTSSTTLRLWKYDAASDTWSFPGALQHWANGDPIQMLPGTAIGITRGYRSDVDAIGIPTEQLFAAIPAVGGTPGTAELQLAMLENAGVDVNQVCIQLGTVFHVPLEVCLATVIQLTDQWAPLPNTVWSGRGGTPPIADVGRVGLAFRPQDPNVWTGPNGGRFYVTWQTRNPLTGIAQARMSLTRGHVMPLDATNPADTVFGLVFLPDSFVHKDGADWPAGMSLIYAGGHVRGAGMDDGFSSRYFPHVDGVFASQERDHDDMTHIKKRLGCALRQCDNLNDD